MSEITFIHLSDIHFRKTSGSSTDIDEDLRNAILTDIQYNAKKRLKKIKGVLVGGDIAFAGKREEYDIAKKFLGTLTSYLEIDEKNIYCVPGNHDVDQKVAQSSRSVYNAQCEIENAETLDDADWYFEKHMSDIASPNLLFKPIEEYNNFAALYGCNINMDRTYWTADFDLGCSMKLKIRGMNSCIISNHDDHKVKDVDRKMYIGQSQLPSYEPNTIWVSLCHHPVEFWKFAEDIQSRLDKRVDIQLYGHKHEQFMDINDKRLAINAGATHPTRGRDWMPRYNWISFESHYQGNDKCIRVKVFSRILSYDRDRFISDQKSCDFGKDYFEYTLNIDKKRRDNLSDNRSGKKEIKYINADDKMIVNGIKKDIVYHFFELSYIQQSEIELISKLPSELRTEENLLKSRKPSEHDPTQVQVIDLFQIILEIKREPIQLGIILSAWDLLENNESVNPKKFLEEKMSMLWQFIESNNKKIFTKVWGVSALGGKIEDVDRLLSIEEPINRIKVVNEANIVSQDVTSIISELSGELYDN